MVMVRVILTLMVTMSVMVIRAEIITLAVTLTVNSAVTVRATVILNAIMTRTSATVMTVMLLAAATLTVSVIIPLTTALRLTVTVTLTVMAAIILKRQSLKLENLESPGIFVEVLESPGIWTYRSSFLIISIQEFSRYTSSEIWVYLCVLKVHEFIEKVLEFDIGRSWKVLEFEMSKCV